jgi:hypothetical protein
MSDPIQKSRPGRIHRARPARRGLTLTELLVAATIMVMIVGAMSMLAMTVHSANDHCQGHSLAAQHGRVVLDHLSRNISAASASEDFPGFLVITEQVGAWKFPDTLAVWLPDGAAANPDGLPRVCEIVLFTPDPAQANCLMRVRQASNTALVPAASNQSAWRTLAASLRSDPTAERVTLTDRLRTGALVEGGGAANVRGCVRFLQLMAPSDAEWTDYGEGDLDWDELAWPLDAYSSTTGMRRVVCQIELQILSGDSETAAATAVPFFGSAGIHYDLTR